MALILGSSAGYGLAATVAGLARHGIQGVAVSMEKAPTERRTASAGWYRTGATAQYARQSGTAMSWLNADCFADETKTQVGDLLAEHYGPVDYLIYSVASRAADQATSVNRATIRMYPDLAQHIIYSFGFVFPLSRPLMNEATSKIKPNTPTIIAANSSNPPPIFGPPH